jgi:uncharacterized cupredoxin-like copper-binding protein
MTEFAFAFSTPTVQAGTIRFKVTNNGGIPHNLRINGRQTPNVDPGGTTILKVTFTMPGNYPYDCTLPGHAAAGMRGVLKVI